jgi:hypothetical protein
MNKNMLKVLLGILFFSGAAALIGAYRSTKNIEYSLSGEPDEYDEDIFV